MDLKTHANQIRDFLLNLKEIKNCFIYGSVAKDSYDEYSDIDLEIDVSGIDNGEFATKLPDLLRSKYDVIFSDYAPSFAPEKYIVSIAISSENPFLIVDICCTAVPHYTNFSKTDFRNLNNHYDHTLKLFTANLKHYSRGTDCYNDIKKMYSRIFKNSTETPDESEMLSMVFSWLKDHAENKYDAYLNALSKYLDFTN